MLDTHLTIVYEFELVSALHCYQLEEERLE